MSYILNAIRKSEQDRQTQEASNPESTLLETQPKQNSKLSWPMIVLIILNILALIYFIFLFLRQQPATTTTATESETPAIAAPIQPEKPKIATKTTIEPSKPELITSMIEQPSAKTVPKPNQKKSISKMLEQRRSFKKPAPEPIVKNVVEVAKKTDSDSPSAPLPTPEKIKPATVKKPLPQAANKPEKSRKIPFLREMAPAFRRNVPKLNINVFVYAKNPDDRFVIIDMKKYRTGQETAEGVEIKEIKGNSLVLFYNNRTFKIARP